MKMLKVWARLETFSLYRQLHVFCMVGQSIVAFKETDINMAHHIDTVWFNLIFVLIMFEDMVCIFILMKIRSFDAEKSRKRVTKSDKEERKNKLIKTSSTTVTEPPKYEDVSEIA